ncbi:hypothetical protein M569_10225 [Genlisea aurea]|uniref:C3H1-type domain-containing protein n=1 Tax=Genlisea aurea TaxID=192259 RepID=S8CIQ1_9LAMI|nr:hypothetical protein M569_10225 [Genlisea aurea]
MDAGSEDAFGSLLELAANNNLEGFKKCVECDPSSVGEVGLWYGRQKGSNQMVLQHMTPLMVAATYGSTDVLKFILSFPEVDVNRSCGVDQSTALHYAASGGTINSVEIVKLLIEAGADPSHSDANGRCPLDVIVVSPKLQAMKHSLQSLLTFDGCSFVEGELGNLSDALNLDSPPSSPSQAIGMPSPKGVNSNRERKEYPIDPYSPDIKNSVYSTDEFRMFVFKVRPCSRAYSHDWTECPFVHPGENARRRDPRKYHYSCVPCPDFRKGACRRGDMCEYAHGVFECWLHPAQYRTRLCKDGTSCNRRVCFFAHKQDELRPLYVPSGSVVSSPRSTSGTTNAMDFAAGMMSPSPNGMPSAAWPVPQQNNVPTLQFPGGNFHSSRLRLSLNARDMPPEDFYADIDAERQHLLLNHSVRSKTMSPSNLEDIFSTEGSSSPLYPDQAMAAAVFSPTHKSAVLNQSQQQQQSTLSPIKTTFSPRNIDQSLLQQVTTSGRMSPRHADPISPISARMSLLAREEMQFRSLSSRDLRSNFASFEEDASSYWSNSSAVFGDDSGVLMKRSSSFELLDNGDEPDLTWVQSLVKESTQDNIVEETNAARIEAAMAKLHI